MQSIFVFLDIKSSWFRWKNADVSSAQGLSRDLQIFLIFFRYVITVSTFFIVGYVLQILGTAVAFPLPSVSSAEKVQS